MDDSDKSFSNLFGILKSWMPRRSESTNVSRDFWMPDHSCRVCYDCDSEFTLFNRRHHCRLCGRVFCGGCTANSIPAQSCEWGSTSEDWDRIRVCNYCFKQWEQGLAASVTNGIQITSINLSPSPSATSFISTKTSGTADTTYTPASMQHSAGSYQQHPYPFEINPQQSAQMETNVEKEGILASTMNSDHATDKAEPSPDPFSFCMNRSDDDESGVYQLDSKTGDFPDMSQYYGPVQFDEIENVYRSYQFHPDGEDIDTKSMSNYSVRNCFDSKDSEGVQHLARKAVNDMVDECEAPTSLYAAENVESEPVDFENNGLLWLPPEPEDEEDEREAFMFDDDDDGDATGEWGYLHGSSSFGSGEFRNREKSNEQHKKAMKNVVDGHFRALVAQLLQVENLSLAEEEESENWLEIVTSLSWEAASILKPDMSTGGGMDPGGYVKIKCLASGHRQESMVIKGVVCKKNVANRRMSSKIEKPQFLILGGALEYQRVSNLLSSVDTLLKQEADHLKMAVAKIDAHNPDVLLVEKSVSRHAQECLLKKDISLVLNIKRPLLERIARCTGGQIVPSIDHLSSQKLGYCDFFHVDKFVQEHGTTDQSGKKKMKTLMYFEGCPKPFGCTILLRGASEDELKKVKHVVQYGVFAAYHLALETSFLADEGASLPELPLNAPLTVTLPDKSSSIDRSISTIPGFSVSVAGNAQDPQSFGEQKKSDSVPTTDLDSRINTSVHITDTTMSPFLSGAPSSQNANMTSSFTNSSAPFSFKSPLALAASDSTSREPFPSHAFTEKMIRGHKESSEAKPSLATNQQDMTGDHRPSNNLKPPQAVIEVVVPEKSPSDTSLCVQNDSDASTFHHEGKNTFEDPLSSKEEFPPSPSDNQSILVSLSSRCVWKGTVCERSHLFRIKYYGSSDKPLGRFLRENLFDQSYRCRSCEMPAEAHVHCYTHRQGTLTISVKRLPEFLLPGEKEGKIWMWHRCLRCPRTNGFPPATRRVLMSDAAWGLSFGKFLELSFSNHAAASRVASCGHSLHRDCLRFYGFGQMVACFRYASIDVHSVYLPPSKLDFNYGNQEWIRRELDEVVERAELLFSEVLNSLHQVEKRPGTGSPDSILKAPKSKHRFVDLEGMLHKEKSEFEELVQKISNKEAKKGQPAIDILEINRARRQLLFQSYIWDHRLVYASSLDTNSLQHNQCDVDLELVDKSPCANEKLVDTSSFNCDLSLADPKFSQSRNEGEFESHVHDPNIDYRTEADLDSKHRKEYETTKSSCTNIHGGCNPVELNSNVCKALPDGQVHIIPCLSDTLEAAWTGENHPGLGTQKKNAANPELIVTDSSVTTTMPEKLDLENRMEDQSGSGVFHSASASPLSTRSYDSMEESIGWLGMSFVNFYRSVNKNFLGNAQKLDKLNDYNPVYISSFRESELQGGARLLLPVGVDDTVVPVFDDEPTSIISYALLSPDYVGQLSDESERPKDISEFSFPVQSLDSGHFQSFSSVDEMALKSFRSLGSADESLISLSGSLGAMVLDPLSYTKALHARVSFADDGPIGKVKYTVTCYYAKRFETLRKICCPSEIDYIRSLSRCKKWGAQGGKSNVFFAKSLDDRFIIKQVTKTELESFIKFAPEYFKYLSASIGSGSPTCLAKILGIYQVSSKHFKGGKETKMDVLVMENLLFGRNLTRLYDLKGSSRSRYNPDSSGSNKVLLDQNLIEAMPTSPIFVGNKAKRLLERAVWNDTAFLASIDVMDYSLLVGVDEENHELVLGIIDFMRQYTWDKHLETWVKASGILGGPKNASPTVISPKQYKKRFRKAMTTYFLMVPDQWSPPTIIQSKSQTDLQEENTQDRATS